MNVTFREQFQKLSLSPDVLEELGDGRLTRFVLHRRERVLEFGLEFSHIIQEEKLEELKEQILSQLPLQDVLIRFRYDCPSYTPAQAVEAEWKNIALRVKQEGYALIPLSLYFKGSKVKMQLGLCKGKKLYDKREDIAKRDAKREMDRAIKERQRG